MGIDGAGARGRRSQSIVGRKLYIPEMSHSGAVAFAAAFRSVGIDAHVCPDSDARTLELGGRHMSGEECLPARVTLGNFLKIVEQRDFVPEKTAFFMPTADGPCRFGQYAPYIKKVLREIGLDDVMVFSPSSRDGYAGIGEQKNELMRNALRGLIAADTLRKMLHRTRPHEITKGTTDGVFGRALLAVEKVMEQQGRPTEARMKELVGVLTEAREAFRKVPADYSRSRPLIGVVGEIFCRLTPFTNESVIRKLEEFGAECTLAHIVEWVWYTNVEAQKRLVHSGRMFSKDMLVSKIKDHIQHKDEHRLHAVFHDDFHGYEEPPVKTIFKYSAPYLPNVGALGEMTLSVGKAIYHHDQGCDGVVDISPFTCMNGIVTEAIYPKVSRDYDHFPIRNFYFDGTQSDLDRDVGIFMELARTYQSRKKVARIYPFNFPAA
jgi:predicted nucleotide-binding protein (sugar kinase/HSP70/actin superfamily)